MFHFFMPYCDMGIRLVIEPSCYKREKWRWMCLLVHAKKLKSISPNKVL